eukprot:TRINITY_DN6319_c0_g2_i2.p1 TRINITY_DN6319_c0_g2~~TRINITY_DN6319_c0_g2_i2.p1  ORF type:complete len:543 (-),score=80.93 TRINITY_DN6319_c0_g2_i2:335-1963(-)
MGAGFCLSRESRKWEEGESTADELLASLLTTFLPVVRRGIGIQLLRWNKDGGGLPLGPGGLYKLRLVRCNTDRDAGLAPDDIISSLEAEVCGVRCKRREESVRIVRRTGDDKVEESDDDGTTPHDFRVLKNEILQVDADLELKLRFAQGAVEFKLEGKKFYSPNLDLTVEEIFVKAKVRIWYNMLHSKLKIAFLEAPQVKWDIDLKLFTAGMPLPDAIEDDLLAWTVRLLLSRFDAENPVEIPIELDQFALFDETTQEVVQMSSTEVDHARLHEAQADPEPPALVSESKHPIVVSEPECACTAAILLTNILKTVLPIVKRGVCIEILNLNKRGGLPLGEKYKLRIESHQSRSNARLLPDEILDTLSATVHHVCVASTPTVKSAVMDEKTESTPITPQGLRSADSRTMLLDIDLEVALRFAKDSVSFKLEAQKFCTPNVDLSIEDLHLRAKVRFAYDMLSSKMQIAFLEPPELDWDVELSLLLVGVPLPDAIEDGLLCAAVRELLGRYTVDNPATIPLNLDELVCFNHSSHEPVKVKTAKMVR